MLPHHIWGGTWGTRLKNLSSWKHITKLHWLFSATAFSWLSLLPGCQKTVSSAKGYVKTRINATMKATYFLPVAAPTYATIKYLRSHRLKQVKHPFLPRQLFLRLWANLFAKWSGRTKHFLFFFNKTILQNLDNRTVHNWTGTSLR